MKGFHRAAHPTETWRYCAEKTENDVPPNQKNDHASQNAHPLG
jgi:hypothetical protein